MSKITFTRTEAPGSILGKPLPRLSITADGAVRGSIVCDLKPIADRHRYATSYAKRFIVRLDGRQVGVGATLSEAKAIAKASLAKETA